MKQQDDRPTSVLSIAGSDSGGGAGIQADLKTFAAHGVHGLTAIAALTAQNTRGVRAIHAPPTAFLADQLDALFEDFSIGATKIGMLATADIIECTAAALDRHAAGNIVLDPVMVASTGATLLAPDALAALREQLVPRAAVLTPNLPEAQLLLGRSIADLDAMRVAAVDLHAMGAASVLLKGGHGDGETVVDLWFDGIERVEFAHPRLPVEGHGTGCTLSSAIAAQLALGRTARDACRLACDYVHGALRHATRPGTGPVSVLAHEWNRQRTADGDATR
ncbi:bifunctional hydroxymethylpyrimidine kinase/phosphomethylpyrimidine kinase [Chiayiivirga flava]|uniref:hydroxymethylpyrimidine kinase n=1 Tax=Chiayiivirga flava TaxID=659595 RepID=A0A7W8D679_9GAMM|nr:bifunctional hydroxymethylpyrimidine kinase/phosphomethylpyrimidine kinase [Chiayiivirga flava]MBB5207018.1 hydroxymethylpyrimidine/phosphomethylpyrimidine kinase [Chiayiivirga flava]